MRFFYDLFFILFAIGYLPAMLLKGKLHKDFPQKFGALPEEAKGLKNPVWIHGVSVGEAAVAAQLAAAIKATSPGIPVIVSTTTRTGNEMIKKAGKGSVDAVFYYPFDISFVVKKVVSLLRPRLYVMIETELWPNLLEELRRQEIPVVLVNGRISDSSYRNYKKMQFITGKILKNIDIFCAQSEQDVKRMIDMGASSENVCVTGSMKFDEGSGAAEGVPKAVKDLVKAEDKIFIAGSTHFPEEQEIIDIFSEISSDDPSIKLILAPRHVERTDAIKIYIEKAGLDCVLMTEVLNGSKKLLKDRGVLLVDTIGHLRELYSLADVVFIGGSIAKKGGQNPIEPARWGKPVIFGPDMKNFRQVAGIFLERDAALSVKDKEELKDVLLRLFGDKEERKKLASRALEVVENNSGATQRTIEKIARYL